MFIGFTPWLQLQVKEEKIYMSSASREFQHMKMAIRNQENRKAQYHKIRTVNTIKWRILMLESLDKLALSPQFDPQRVEDLRTIVMKVPEERFIEAIINLQPYKPNFKTNYSLKTHTKNAPKPHCTQSPQSKDMQDETTTSGSTLKRFQAEGISAAKQLKRKQQLIAMFIEDDLLSSQISSPNHPYTKIIDAFTVLLENRYKLIIDQQASRNNAITVEQLSERLAKDYNLVQNFFKFASAPIVDIFNLTDQKQRQKITEEVNNFLVNYLRNNEKICLSIRKILRYHIRTSKELKDFTANCPHLAQVQKFGLPTKFQIEGCYVYATTQIINFSQLTTGKECLSQLAVIRDAIYRDIDEYYKDEKKSFQVCSQVQLEILKFSLVKVHIFAGQILAELKMLQILYGSEEMSYLFDQASYIHSQLSIAFEAIQHNL